MLEKLLMLSYQNLSTALWNAREIVDALLSKPSTALRNAREIVDALISKHGTKNAVPPVLIIYSDEGPEHCTMFLNVKIAMIASHKFLDLDMLLLAHIAPGHSWANPAEKIILNLGLYVLGVMHSTRI